jgi:general secretion pathway protein E
MTAPQDVSPKSLLPWLRERARCSDLELWDALAERLAAPADACRAWLATALEMDALDMAALHALEPDFRTWSHADAMASRTLVARVALAADEITCITQNPFNLTLQGRMEAGLAGPARWCLVHPDDLTA